MNVTPSICISLASALLALHPSPLTAAPLGTAFTYHGRLQDGAGSANGVYDWRFAIYDSASGPAQVGVALTNASVAVSNGLFAVALDFGAGLFTGEARWLEIAVRTNVGSEFTILQPRQELTPTPFAHYAPSAGTAASVPAANLTGSMPDARLSTNVALLSGSPQFAGTVSAAGFAGNGAALTGLDVQAVGPPGTFSLVWLGFTPGFAVGVGAGPEAVAAADVNGDGWVDLVSANSAANALTVLTNNRAGGFATSASPAVGASPRSVAVADVNRDGWADLVSANSDANTLTVLTNNRAGGFALAASPGVGSGPCAVAAVDVNGDGWADLVSANSSVGTLTVLTNNRNAGFAVASSPAVGSQPYAVATADLDGDGWMDLVSANNGDSTLTVLTNNRSGAFAVAASPGVGLWPAAVAAADVNGDGWADLISANYGGDTLTVLTNNRSGRFTAAASPNVGGSPVAVAAADVNKDGWPDLVTSDFGDHTLTVVTNNGSGRFAWAATLGSVWGTRSVAAADVNGDGRVDLASADRNVSTLTLFLNRNALAANLIRVPGGLGIGVAPTTNALEVAGTVSATGFRGSGAGLTSLPAANLVGTIVNAQVPAVQLVGTVPDARLSANVALLNRPQTFSGANRFPQPGNVFTGQFFGSGAGLTDVGWNALTLGGALSISSVYNTTTNLGVADNPAAAVAADFNGDGHPDLACVCASDVTIATNRGNGTFKVSGYGNAGGEAIAAADFDGDGVPDLAVAETLNDRVSVLFGDGRGGIRHDIFDRSVDDAPFAVAAVDVNGDQSADLVIAHRTTDTLTVLTNDGAGEFRVADKPDARFSVTGLVTADVNGDGWCDCITGVRTGGAIVLTNNGQGQFFPLSDRPSGPPGDDIKGPLATADFNRDGYPDLVALEEPPRCQFYVLLNQAGTNFAVVSTNTLSHEATCVSVADFNGDAFPDLAIGVDEWFADGIHLFINDGQGRLALKQTVAPRGPPSLLAVDLNGNKQPDLVCVEGPADTLSILLGTPHLNYDGANLGLGRFPTANRFEVEGNASKTTAGSWLANSDRRIKQDIASVTNALETLAKVRLVSFRYTDEYRAAHPSVADRAYLNVVAQEFQEVFPEYVQSSGENPAGGGGQILQVDTYPLTIYSAAAVQELNRKLAGKEAEIGTLQQSVAELRALVNDLSLKLNGRGP